MIKHLPVFALFALIMASLPAGADVDPRFQAMAHNTLKEYAQACDVLEANYPSDTTDVDVLFLLGQCKAGQGKFTEARRAYKKLVDLDPTADQVRAEIAATYHAEGRVSEARAAYQDVLDSNPPPGVRGNIERAMAALDGRKPWYARVSMGAIYDSNVRSGPSDRDITAFGLPFSLSDSSLEEDSVGFFASALGGFSQPLNPHWRLSYQGSVNHRDYENDDFDTQTASLAAGPVFQRDALSFALLPRVSGQTFGGALYRLTYGSDISAGYALNDSWGVEASSGIQGQDYFTTTGRDGFLAYGFAGLNYSLSLGQLSTGYQIRSEEAEDEVNSNLAHGPRIAWRGNTKWLRYYLAYQFTRTEYDAPEPIFAVTRTDDTHTLDATASLPLFASEIPGLALDLGYSYYDNSSNVPLNTYDRHISTLGVSKRW